MKVSRRDFIKLSSIAITAVTLTKASSTKAKTITLPDKRVISHDITCLPVCLIKNDNIISSRH